jgi:hypothetical protein
MNLLSLRARPPRAPSTFRLAALALAFSAAACGEGTEPGVNLSPGLTGDGAVDTGVSPQPEAGTQIDSSVAAPDTGAPNPARDASMDATALQDSGAPDTGVVVDAGADAGDAGSSGNLGIGLEGTSYQPFPTTGMPLDTPDGAWKYHEFPDTWCRNGTKAGITVFKNSASKKVMFFFEGGGACFDGQTCLTNPEAVDATDKSGPTGGVFDRTNAANPVKDWNFVYLPYCTGDVFGGTRADVTIDGATGPQKFVGYLNSQAFLQRVVPTFKDATDVLVTGVSAGGFGASTNVILIQRAFPNLKVKLINDSGPPMGSPTLATCLQKKWRETWGFDQSVLKDCGANCPNPDDFSFDYGVHLAKTFKGRYSGLIESAEDGIITGFYGIGANNCTGILLLTPVSGPDFSAALRKYREAVKGMSPTFGTYFPPGTQHTWLMGASFYTGNIGGTKLVDWVTDIVTEKGTKHLGL